MLNSKKYVCLKKIGTFSILIIIFLVVLRRVLGDSSSHCPFGLRHKIRVFDHFSLGQIRLWDLANFNIKSIFYV